jgi:hypothetical protein
VIRLGISTYSRIHEVRTSNLNTSVHFVWRIHVVPGPGALERGARGEHRVVGKPSHTGMLATLPNRLQQLLVRIGMQDLAPFFSRSRL